MTYSEIKKEIQSLETAISGAKRYDTSLTSVIKKEEEEIEKIKKQLPLAAQAEKDKQFKEHLSKGLAPFNEKATNLSKKISQLKDEEESRLSAISLETIEQEMLTSDKLINQIKAITETVEEKLQSNLGERMVETIKGHLGAQKFSDSEEEIRKSFKNLKQLNRRLQMKVKKEQTGFSLADGFDDVWGNLMSSNRTNLIAFYIMLSLLFLVFIGFIAPVLFALILLLCIKSLQTNYLYYQALVECTKVLANYDKLSDIKREQAKNLFDKRKEGIRSKYGKKREALEEQLTKANTAITSKTIELQKNFVFDEKIVEAQIKSQVEVRQASVDESKRKLQDNRNELNKMESRMGELQNALGDSLALLKEEYLNPKKLGTEEECISEILLDFKNESPVFFKFNKVSSYFVYKDARDLIGFIRLFISQIRAKMDSEVYTIDVWDSRMFGSGYIDMTTPEMPLLGMSTVESDIRDDLELKTQIMMKRIGKVKRANNDIFEYNQYLISIDSLVEPYNFIFCIEQPPSLFASDAAKSLLGESSYLSGVFVLYFISDEELKKDKKTVDLIDHFECGYLIEHGEIYTKSRDFIKKMYQTT